MQNNLPADSTDFSSLSSFNSRLLARYSKVYFFKSFLDCFITHYGFQLAILLQFYWHVSGYGQSVKKTSNGHNSATRHPIPFMFGSTLGFLARTALLNLTAHKLHELYYDRPTS